jgi:hypothetical protein
MRACEGCRRRKIKCDAATTNTWPCAACTRLKLTCVPPTVSYEKDSTAPGVHTFELQGADMFPISPVSGIGEYQQQHPYSTVDSTLSTPLQGTYADLPVYHNATFVEPSPAPDILQFDSLPASTVSQNLNQPVLYSPPPSSAYPATSERSWKSESGISSLSEVLGDLRITPNATGT